MNLLPHRQRNILFPIMLFSGLCLTIIRFLQISDFAFRQHLGHLAIILVLIFLPLSGTNIYSATDGIVSYLAFQGANGYTIQINNQNAIFSYSHVDPNFIVNIGDSISKNQLIGKVGPKYIESIPHNPYTDSTGQQTNGATTGCHLHFSVKIDGKAIDPQTLFH